MPDAAAAEVGQHPAKRQEWRPTERLKERRFGRVRPRQRQPQRRGREPAELAGEHAGVVSVLEGKGANQVAGDTLPRVPPFAERRQAARLDNLAAPDHEARPLHKGGRQHLEVGVLERLGAAPEVTLRPGVRARGRVGEPVGLRVQGAGIDGDRRRVARVVEPSRLVQHLPEQRVVLGRDRVPRRVEQQRLDTGEGRGVSAYIGEHADAPPKAWARDRDRLRCRAGSWRRVARRPPSDTGPCAGCGRPADR